MKFFYNNKKTIFSGLIIFFIAVICYSQLMTQGLTNSVDGLWESSFHNAGAWELSIGRWFWLYLSRMRFGTSPDPITSILALLIYLLGVLLFFDYIELNSLVLRIVLGVLFLCSPMITMSLSYRYMSPTFATAFTLSIASLWVVKKLKNPYIAVFLCSIMTALSLGSYQAYISCSTVALLVYSLLLLKKGSDRKIFFASFTKSCIGILLGCIFYVIALRIHLALTGIQMADYYGGNQYSILNCILGIPSSTSRAFYYFKEFLTGTLYLSNRILNKQIYIILSCLSLVYVVFCLINIFKKKDWLYFILFIVCILLLPFGANSMLYIATGATLALQSACGLYFLFPALLGVLLTERIDFKKEKIVTLLATSLVIVFTYGSCYQVITDQSVMAQGKKSCESITSLILSKLTQENLLSTDYTYCFYGSCYNSDLYIIDRASEHANTYAFYGAWYSEPGNTCKSWKGLINKTLMLNLNMADASTYTTYGAKASDMACFPNEGSIQKIDNVILIKVSE